MNLGPCCCCGKTQKVRNAIMLHHKAPIAGRGWGCVVCGLPGDGAMAVVCDRCYDHLRGLKDVEAGLKWACKGYPATDGRVPIAEVLATPAHEHNMTKHQPGD